MHDHKGDAHTRRLKNRNRPIVRRRTTHFSILMNKIISTVHCQKIVSTSTLLLLTSCGNKSDFVVTCSKLRGEKRSPSLVLLPTPPSTRICSFPCTYTPLLPTHLSIAPHYPPPRTPGRHRFHAVMNFCIGPERLVPRQRQTESGQFARLNAHPHGPGLQCILRASYN